MIDWLLFSDRREAWHELRQKMSHKLVTSEAFCVNNLTAEGKKWLTVHYLIDLVYKCKNMVWDCSDGVLRLLPLLHCYLYILIKNLLSKFKDVITKLALNQKSNNSRTNPTHLNLIFNLDCLILIFQSLILQKYVLNQTRDPTVTQTPLSP